MHELEQTFLLERLLPQLDANPDDTRRTCSSFRTDKVGSFRAFFGRHGTRRTPNSKCVMSRKAVRVRESARRLSSFTCESHKKPRVPTRSRELTKITVRNLGKSKLHHNLLSRIDCRNVQETLAL